MTVGIALIGKHILSPFIPFFPNKMLKRKLSILLIAVLCSFILSGQQVKDQNKPRNYDSVSYHNNHMFVTGMERVGHNGEQQPKFQRVSCKRYIQHLRTVIKKFPDSYRARNAYFCLAFEYHYLKKYEKAVEAAKKCLSLREFNEDESEMLFLLARIYGSKNSPLFDKTVGLKYVDRTLEKFNKNYTDLIYWKARALKEELSGKK